VSNVTDELPSVETPIGRVLATLINAQRDESTDGYIATCPAHDESDAPVTVTHDSTGAVSIECLAGCTTQAVLDAIGITSEDLKPDQPVDIPAAIRAAVAAGLSAVPVPAGAKHPSIKWKPFQTALATDEQLAEWGAADAFVIVGGKVSGGLTCIDFDSARFYRAWRVSVGDLADGLVVIQTGRGFHVWFRSPNPGRSVKLAWFPQEGDTDGRKCAIETKAEGGVTVGPGSPHKSGKRYRVIQGDWLNTPVISQVKADALIGAAIALCECPLKPKQIEIQQKAPDRSASHRQTTGQAGESVIDRFNRETNLKDLLEDRGYRRAGDRMLRPNAESTSEPGVSFYERNGLDVCYAWSSNDALKDGHCHNAFSAFCTIDHGGDVKKAVRAAAVSLGIAYEPSNEQIGSELQHQQSPRQDGPYKVPGADEKPPEPLIVTDITDIIADNPNERPYIIRGLTRQGETMNVISGPKTFKSHTIGSLLIAGVVGGRWLDTWDVEPGKVLLLDNELYPSTLAARYRAIAHGLGVHLDDLKGKFSAVSLRGKLRTLFDLEPFFASIEPDEYSMIAIDAIYRFLPGDEGAENSNAIWTAIYNFLDRHAMRLRCMFIVVHHTSKGLQAGKAITDVGAGAGAQSRAADCHLIIRPHQEDGAVVVEAECRTFAKPDPIGLRWSYPVWRFDPTLDTSQLQTERRSGRPRKENGDRPPAEPKTVWTAQLFADSFIGDQPSTRSAIIAKAVSAGVSDRKATLFLAGGAESGLFYEWPPKKARDPQRYCKRPPELMDVTDTETGEVSRVCARTPHTPRRKAASKRRTSGK
jgi:hypothetical protein